MNQVGTHQRSFIYDMTDGPQKNKFFDKKLYTTSDQCNVCEKSAIHIFSLIWIFSKKLWTETQPDAEGPCEDYKKML